MIQIKDLCLATTISIFYNPVGIKRDANKAIFVFPENHDVKKLIVDYWKNKIQVEPKTFFYHLKDLKSRIYSLASQYDSP